MAAELIVGSIVPAQPVTPVQDHDPARRFVPGQTLRGIVLRPLPGGQSLVNFGGQHLLLDLKQPLALGQTLLVTVENTEPTLVLRVLDHPTPPHVPAPATPSAPPDPLPTPGDATPAAVTLTAAQIKPYLVDKQPLGEVIRTLQQHVVSHPLLQHLDPALLQHFTDTLALLLPGAEDVPDAARLQTQLDRSGLTYEAKVVQVLTGHATLEAREALAHDLKGQLLALAASLEQPPVPHGDQEALLQHVQHALCSIEFQQLANLFAQQEQQALLWPLLHASLTEPHTARLYVHDHARDARAPQDTPRHVTLVLLLQLTQLGALRVDATVHGTYLTATLRTPEPHVAAFLAAQVPALTARLHDLGFQAAIQCHADANVPFDVEDTFTRVLLATPSHLLDISV